MTNSEFMIFGKALKTYYPRDTLLPSTEAMELWYRALADIPYESAEQMLIKWVATEKWPPTIADIRAGCATMQFSTLPSWEEGWKAMCECIHRYGYMRPLEGIEALKKLNPIAAYTASRLGWEYLCESDNVSADRANFRDIYERQKAEANKDAALPAPHRVQNGLPDSIRKEKQLVQRSSSGKEA